MNTSKSGGSCIRSTDCVNIFILVFILCYRDFHASTAGDTRRAGLPRRLTVPWTRPQDEVRRGPDAGFPRAGAEAPLPRCGLRQKMGEGGLRGNGEERVTEELGGGEASSVSGSPFTLARDELFPFRTGGATLTWRGSRHEDGNTRDPALGGGVEREGAEITPSRGII